MPDCFNVLLSLVSVQYVDVLNFINHIVLVLGTDVYLCYYYTHLLSAIIIILLFHRIYIYITDYVYTNN